MGEKGGEKGWGEEGGGCTAGEGEDFWTHGENGPRVGSQTDWVGKKSGNLGDFFWGNLGKSGKKRTSQPLAIKHQLKLAILKF